MRSVRRKNRDRADELTQRAQHEGITLEVLELDVLSEVGCRAAVDRIGAQHGQRRGLSTAYARPPSMRRSATWTLLRPAPLAW